MQDISEMNPWMIFFESMSKESVNDRLNEWMIDKVKKWTSDKGNVSVSEYMTEYNQGMGDTHDGTKRNETTRFIKWNGNGHGNRVEL